MPSVKVKIFLFGLILLWSLNGFAQPRNNIDQALLWYGVSLTKKLPNHYSLTLKVERRDFISPARKQQLVIPDINLAKKINDRFSLDAGVWIFNIYQPGVDDLPVTGIQYEWRPYFTVDYKMPALEGSLEFALKSEYRGFNAADAANRFDQMFEYYVIRERFLVRYSYSINEQLSARVSEELHLNLAGNFGQGTFDQNRITGDFIYTHTLKNDNQLKFNAGYLHWYQATGISNTYFNHHITTTGIGYTF